MPGRHAHTHTGSFPAIRLRRLRAAPWIRELTRENRLHPSDLILPLFLQEGKNAATPIAAMPGVERLSIDRAIVAAREAQALGIPAVGLFPVVDAALKTSDGHEALNEDNLVCRAIRAIKSAAPEIGVIADVALDPYTTHGHDGVIRKGDVVNDETVDLLCEQAVLQARAGCDIVAPSDMMDGRVSRIRAALDAAGFAHVAILAYSAKYASALYGPFRDAVGSAQALGNACKRGYQMDPANGDEAMREIALDVAEGADMVMVKPGIAYLDVIRRAADMFDLPVLAYQVSGEYAMIKAASAQGWIDGGAVMHEMLLSFKRAGSQAIFTYAALDVARDLARGGMAD